MNPTRQARGYTLLDLLICATITACLSAIALPSYHRTVLKDRRAVARNTLVDLAAKQEHHRRVHRVYATTVGELVGAQNPTPYYRLEVLEAGAVRTEICGVADPEASAAPAALSAIVTGPQSADHACNQLILCFAGRPGAKAAFDNGGRSTPAIRDACWELQRR